MRSLLLKREDMYPMLMTVLLLYVSEQMPNFYSTSPRNYSSSGPNIWTWASYSRGSAGGTKLVNVQFVCWGACQGVSVVCQRLQQERERLDTNKNPPPDLQSLVQDLQRQLQDLQRWLAAAEEDAAEAAKLLGRED